MNPLHKNRIKQIFIYSAAVLTGLLLLSPFIITQVINTQYIKKKTATFLYQKTGAHIDGSKFSLAIFPGASISIHEFKFKFNPDNEINIFVDFLKFNIDIKQLLQGRINIDQITIDGPEIKSRKTKQKTVAFPLDVSLLSDIKDVKKIFDFLPEHQNSVELKFKNAASQYFRHMDGSLYLSKEKQEIRLNTTLKKIKFRPSTLSNAVFEKYPDLNLLELDQLNLNANINSKGEIKGIAKFIAPKLYSRKKAVLLDANDIESSFKLSEDGCQIAINPFKLNYPKGTMGVHFKDDRIQKKSILRFTGTRIHIDQARQMSLKLFKDNGIVKDLFQILEAGIAPNVMVSFQSKDLKDLFKGNNLRLEGTIEKGLVNIPATELKASDVFGEAQVLNGILDINTTNAIIQNSKLEKGHLSIELLNDTNVPFQGKFSLDLDLSQIPQTLISLLPDTLLARELSLVHDVKGRSKAQLTLSLEPNDSDLKVEVNAPDLSVTGYYDRIPGSISIENTMFSYGPDQVSLNHLNALINGSKMVDFNTQINFKDETWIKIQSGSAYIDLASTLPWLMSNKKTRDMILPVKDGNGKLHITSIEFTGPLLKPELGKYDLKGTSDKISITTKSNQRQIENLSCQFHLSNNFFNADQIRMRVIDLSWIKNLIEKKHLDSILVPFNLENGNFQMNATHSSFKTDLIFPTGPMVQIDLKGDAPALFAVNSIKILDEKISNASIYFNNNKNKPLFDFKGRLNTATLNKIIISGNFWAKKIKDLTEGQSLLIDTDKNSNLNITTRSIDLNSIFSQAQVASMDTQLLSDKTIHFKADQVKLKQFILNHIDTHLFLKKDSSHIKLNKAFLCDMEAKGTINFQKNILDADIVFTADNKTNIQDLFTCLLKKNDFMDGLYSLSGNLKTNGNGKDFLNTLTGAVILNVQKGRIYKLTLLSRILSVLNVSKIFKGKIPDVTQNGFAYNNIFLEADIKDSRIYLTKAIIDGKDMTMIFSGWIDPVNDSLDLTCLVAPFKTIDLIIEKIPVINTLLSGRLLSVPAKATGKLSDPVVVPLHPSAVGDGLITMMSDILKTPVKLWDKIYNE
jgi:AsmA-like C-terminal region